MHISPPSNNDFEMLLLSAAMNSPAYAGFVFLETIPEDYHFHGNRSIFMACRALYSRNEPLDIEFIISELKKDEGGKDLKELVFNIAMLDPIGLDCKAYIAEIKNLSSLRQIIKVCKDGLMQASLPDADSDKIIDEIQQRLILAQGQDSKSAIKIKAVLDDYARGMDFHTHLDWMIEQRRFGKPTYEGISSGYPILDEALGFFRNGCIYYIGARTSMGKTTFILNLLHNMKNHNVGVFSLEMSAPIITAKLLCIAADVRYSLYEDGCLFPEKVDRLREVATNYSDKEIYIEEGGGLTINQLRSRAKRMKSTYGIEVLFIDYLTLINGNSAKSNNHLQVNEVSKGLQALAKELNIPIICLAQLNRQSAKDSMKENTKPSLTDFRESGSIEEDADACIMLHRADYYKKDAKPGYIEVIVAKNRLRGIIKTIDFSCDYLNSDRYSECRPIEEEMKEAREQNQCDDMMCDIINNSPN
jgi:replicative DNA helicase